MESPKTGYSASVAEATRNPNFCSRGLLPGTVVGLSQCCLISTAFPKAKPTAYHLLRPLAVGGRLSSKTTVHSNSPQRILVGGLACCFYHSSQNYAHSCWLMPTEFSLLPVHEGLPMLPSEDFYNILWSTPSILPTFFISPGSCWASPVTNHSFWGCPCLTHLFLSLPSTLAIRNQRWEMTQVCAYTGCVFVCSD